MATEQFHQKQRQMSELLFEVIELAGKPENQDALGGLRHMLLGDAGTMLANSMQKAGTSLNGVKCMAVSPENAYMTQCRNMQQKEREM